jgi:hypothetical protein
MVQMSQVLQHMREASHPQTRDVAEARVNQMLRLGCALFATLNETVVALQGDVPGGGLEQLGQPSRYLTVGMRRLASRTVRYADKIIHDSSV